MVRVYSVNMDHIHGFLLYPAVTVYTKIAWTLELRAALNNAILKVF